LVFSLGSLRHKFHLVFWCDRADKAANPRGSFGDQGVEHPEGFSQRFEHGRRTCETTEGRASLVSDSEWLAMRVPVSSEAKPHPISSKLTCQTDDGTLQNLKRLASQVTR